MKKLFILGILLVVVIMFILLIINNTIDISFKDESEGILFLAENENWLAKIKVVYDPNEISLELNYAGKTEKFILKCQ